MWIEPGESIDTFVNWENLYLNLPNGEYRYVMSFFINDRTPVVYEEDNVNLAFEFSVDDYGEPVDPEGVNASVCEPDTAEGFSVTVDMASLTPKGCVINIRNDCGEEVTYGAEYEIWRKIDGKWFKLRPVADEIAWNDIGYLSVRKTPLWRRPIGSICTGACRTGSTGLSGHIIARD